ncbi:MAG TPA: ClpXP protease specificity-enhancing factor SspB [Stellaceae bacterium]|nr:ClpXP protease specificity-enhancing factor SspB [Stellaceae bacterium]
MAQDLFDYPKMVETALRGVMREALARTAREGLPGDHHFYVTFRTRAPGVGLPTYLLSKFPDEMTIVLQHQFRALEVGEDAFSVNLSFQSRSERLRIPFAAVTTFADPSVNFGLQFEVPAAPPAEMTALPAQIPPPEPEKPAEPAEPARPAAEVVTLDKFRKR